MHIIKGFGFIDLIFIILWLRISYAAVSKGAFVEILKIIALVFGSIIAFQFYPFFTDKIATRITFLNKNYLNVITFLALFSILGIIFGLTIKIVNELFKRKEISSPEKFIALVLGFVRFSFLASIIVFLFYLIPARPQVLNNGLSLQLFKKIAPKTYLASADILNNINPKFSINTEVKKAYEAENHLSGDNKKGN